MIRRPAVLRPGPCIRPSEVCGSTPTSGQSCSYSATKKHYPLNRTMCTCFDTFTGIKLHNKSYQVLLS